MYGGLLLVVWWTVIVVRSQETNIYISRNDGIYHADLTDFISNPTRVKAASNGEVVGLAIDTHERLIFWSDSSTGKEGIYKGTISTTSVSSEQRIVSYDKITVNGLAVDWLYKHLYWTDSFYSCVMVADYNGNHRLFAVSVGMLLPRGILVDPVNRVLYVGDQGTHSVSKCIIDGSFSCTQLNSNQSMLIVWPNQLHLDGPSRNLSWTDGWSNKVTTCQSNLMGCVETAVQTNSFSVNSSVTLFGLIKSQSGLITSSIDDFTTYVVSSNMSRGTSLPTGNTYYMVSSDTSTQPIPSGQQHQCMQNNGGCAQLCFPSGNDVSCTCSSQSATVLTRDKTCAEPDRFLLYIDRDRGHIGMISTSLKGHTLLAYSKQPQALAYDAKTKMLLFSDSYYQSIYKLNLGGQNLTTFLSREDGIGNVIAMSIDPNQRRLYFLNKFTWSLTNDSRSLTTIEMAGLETTERVTVLGTDQTVVDIEIVQKGTSSLLYYAVTEPSPKVIQLSLDGRISGILQLNGLRNPTQLSSIEGTLYILDNRDTPTLYSHSGLTSQESLARQAVSMAAGSSYVYFSHNQSLSKHDVNTKFSTDIIPSNVNAAELLYVDKGYSISPDVGLCDDDLCTDDSVCFKTTNEQIVRCRCPSDKFNVISEDNRACNVPNRYLLVTDVTGIKMVPLDTHGNKVFTLVSTRRKCAYYHGLASDGKRIFFAEYNGKILYMSTIRGEELTVFKVLREMTILNLAYSNGKLFWTGFYDCYYYNGTHGGLPECDSFNGRLGGIFTMNVSSDSDQEVTALKSDINNPSGIIANPSSVYWSEGDEVKRLSLLDSAETVVIGQRKLYSLQQSNDQQHIFGGGNNVIFRRFAAQGDFSQDELLSSVSNIRGMEVKGSLLFASDWENKNVIQYDLRSYQTKVVADNLGRPGQIVAFGLDSTNLDKPGECTRPVGSCNNVSIFDCNEDIDCVGFYESKCCLVGMGNQCRRQCTSPATNTACNITFSDNQPSFTWGDQEITNSHNQCQTCSCDQSGRSSCRVKQCPPLTGCQYIVSEPGQCCNVCRDISTCKEKPTIKGCDRVRPIEIRLNDTIHESPYNIPLEGHPQLKTITAFSCNKQELKSFSLFPESVSSGDKIKTVKLYVRDKNGLDTCEFEVHVVDTHPPVFTNSINGTLVQVITKDSRGAKVLWTPVVAKDNSGITPKLSSNYTNGEVLPRGIHDINFDAEDQAKNKQSIKFYAEVKVLEGLKCEEPPYFHHGSFECKKNQTDGFTCIAKCSPRYQLKAEFKSLYSCVKGQYEPPFPSTFIDACFKPEPTLQSATTSFKFDCPNANVSPSLIIDCLQLRGECYNTEIRLCNEESITVQQSEASVTVTATVTTSVSPLADQSGIVAANKTLLKKLDNLDGLFGDSSLTRHCPFIACSFRGTQQRKFGTACEIGSIFYNIQGGKQFCGKCPPGTKFQSHRCDRCPQGTYQEEPGRTKCMPCPKNKPNSQIGAWRRQQCTNKKIAAPEDETDLIPIVGGVVGVVAVLVLVVVVVLIVLRRRRPTKKVIQSHANPTFDLHENDNPYDELSQCDKNDLYQKLEAAKADPANEYAVLGGASTVSYTKVPQSAGAAKDTEDNPYTSVTSEKVDEHPYQKLQLK